MTTALPAQDSLPILQATLENGLRVLLQERHNLPVVSCMIWYRVGSADEPAGLTGVAHFLEHMLFKGTDRYRKGEIDAITLRNGGSNNAFTAEDYTAYFFNFASDRWEAALTIEANRMRNCLLDPDELEAEKKVVLEELQLYRDAPGGKLGEEIEALSFLVHPYHHPILGYREDLEAMERDRMLEFYRRHYNPSNATIVVVGDFESEAVFEKIQGLFGAIEPGDPTPDVGVCEPPAFGERRVVLRDEGEVPRVMLAYRGTRFSDPRTVVLDVLGHLLSSGKSSALYQRLIEKGKMASSVDSQNDARRDPGLFYITADLRRAADPVLAEEAIEDELGRLARGGPTPEELQRAINIASAEHTYELETVSGVATRIGLYEVMGDHEEYGRYLERLQGVTVEDVRAAAAEVFRPEGKVAGLSYPRRSGEAPGGTSEGSGEVKASPHRKDRQYRSARSRAEARGETDPIGGAERMPHGGAVSVSSSPASIVRTVLDNGLVVLTREARDVPVVAFDIHVDAGRRHEPPGLEGLSRFTGRMLDEGTHQYTHDQISLALESVGGRLTTHTTGLRLLAMSKDRELSLRIASDCVIDPVFPANRVDRERDQTLAEIRADRDDPRQVALRTIREMIYGDHPFHSPPRGYEESVARISRESLVAFHSHHYRPDRAVVAISGDFDTDEMLERVAKSFGDWRPRESEWAVRPIPAVTRQDAPREEHRPMEKEQLNIYTGHLGVPRTHPDYHRLLVMDHVLGTGPGFTNRMSRHLRDELGLAYTVHASITESATEEPGMFLGYIGTSPENRTTAVEGLREEVRKFLEEGPSWREVDDAQRYLTGSFIFNMETAAQMARLMVEVERYGLGVDYIERFGEIIEQVTRDEVLDVARKHLDPEAMSVAICGQLEQ